MLCDKKHSHSFFKRSGLDNLQLTIVVGQCELSDMLLFRYYRFSDVPHRGLATHRKEFISYGPCTKGFRQFSFAHT